jgi:arylformamidase
MPCQVGPAPHDKGAKVWMDLDQIELDSAYDQAEYAPMIAQILKRFVSRSAEVREQLGEPKRFNYGPTPIEALDVFPAKTPSAPVFVFVHGGAWRSGEAKDYAFAAELFVAAGVNFVVILFQSTRPQEISASWRGRYAMLSHGPTRMPPLSGATAADFI